MRRQRNDVPPVLSDAAGLARERPTAGVLVAAVRIRTSE